MILFVHPMMLSFWSFWNLARQGTNASPFKKASNGWDGDENYALFDDKMRVSGSGASTLNGILEWRDSVVKASYIQYFYIFYGGIQFLPTGGSKPKMHGGLFYPAVFSQKDTPF
jgi:hypothetical protein